MHKKQVAMQKKIKISDASKRIKRNFYVAKKVAAYGTYGKIKHGAVLVKGGKVINTSFNKENFSSFGSRFRKKHTGLATVHAELGVVLGISKKVASGCDIFVVRLSKSGDFRLSKPCSMCHDILKFMGIKRVYYTLNDDAFDYYKIS